MRKASYVLAMFFVAFLLMGLWTSCLQAQEPMSIWEGKWFKLWVSWKGLESKFSFSDPNKGEFLKWVKALGKMEAYLEIPVGAFVDPNSESFFDGDEYFRARLWFLDDEGSSPESMDLELNLLPGSPLDFLVWVISTQGDLTAAKESAQGLGFLLRFQGKLDQSKLVWAKIKSLGGTMVMKEYDQGGDLDPSNDTWKYTGGTLSMKGQLSQKPSWIP